MVRHKGEVEHVGGVVLPRQRVQHLRVNPDLDEVPLRVAHLEGRRTEERVGCQNQWDELTLCRTGTQHQELQRQGENVNTYTVDQEPPKRNEFMITQGA